MSAPPLTLSLAVAAVLFCVGTRLVFIVPTALAGIHRRGVVHHERSGAAGARIEAWLDLENPVHQLDRGMQQWRALLALGNGGPWGVGLGNGVEKFGTLTFAHIDFIFPVIGEELGLPFTLGVVFCYVLIAVAGCGIALQAHERLQPLPGARPHLRDRGAGHPEHRRHHRDAAQRRPAAALRQLRRHQPGASALPRSACSSASTAARTCASPQEFPLTAEKRLAVRL